MMVRSLGITRSGRCFLAATLLMSGCAATMTESPEQARANVGFLTDYGLLSPVDDDPYLKSLYRAVSAEEEPPRWSSVIVEPPEIFISVESEYKGMSPRDFSFVADSAVALITAGLSGVLTPTDRAGADTLVLRIALTNVRLKKRYSKNPFAYTPFGLLKNAVFSDFKDKIDLARANIEIEFLDSTNDRVIGAAIESLGGHGNGDDAAAWDDIDDRLRELGRRVRCELGDNRDCRVATD